MFIGVGLGAAVNYLLGISPKHNINFWLIIACFVGIGMLVSFIIETKMQKKQEETDSASKADSSLCPYYGNTPDNLGNRFLTILGIIFSQSWEFSSHILGNFIYYAYLCRQILSFL